VSANIQHQIDNIPNNNNVFTGINTFDNNIIVNDIEITPNEISNLYGTTSNIQTQLDNTL
jgi:hypothetical protein